MTPKRNGKAIGEVVPGDMRSKSGVRSRNSGVGSRESASCSADRIGTFTFKFVFAGKLVIIKMKLFKVIFIPADTFSITKRDIKKPGLTGSHI